MQDDEILQTKPPVPDDFDPPSTWEELMSQEMEDHIMDNADDWTRLHRPCPRCDEPGGIGFCPNCHRREK